MAQVNKPMAPRSVGAMVMCFVCFFGLKKMVNKNKKFDEQISHDRTNMKNINYTLIYFINPRQDKIATSPHVSFLSTFFVLELQAP